MKLQLKYALEGLIKAATRVFCLVPLKNRVLFQSFSGRQYSDSPRRISERLAEEAPGTKQVWAFLEPEKFAFLRERGVEHAETNLNLETNYAIRNLWKRADSHEHKKRRSYIKKLTE